MSDFSRGVLDIARYIFWNMKLVTQGESLRKKSLQKYHNKTTLCENDISTLVFSKFECGSDHLKIPCAVPYRVERIFENRENLLW